MERSLVVHIVLAVAAATAAYIAWTKPAESSADTVVIVPGSAERLSRVTWNEDRFDVQVERGEPDVQVTVQRYDTPKKPVPKPKPEDAPPEGIAAPEPGEAGATDASEKPATDEPAAPAEPAKPTPRGPARTYPGTKQATELFDKLAPFEAARALGKVADDKLESLGLKDPKSTLTLEIGERKHVLKIGNATYGSGDSYVITEEGEVFLVSSSKLSGLRHGASTLLDRNAVGVEREQVERLAVSVGPRGRELVQRFAEDKAKAFWADPAEPDVKLELVGNWLDRVLRLRVVEIVDEAPKGPPSVEVEMFRGNDSLGLVKIWSPGERTALVTSSRYGKTVTVAKATAEAIIKDLENVLSEGR